MYMFQFHVWSKNAKSRRYPSCLESVILEIASRLKINYGVNELNDLNVSIAFKALLTEHIICLRYNYVTFSITRYSVNLHSSIRSYYCFCNLSSLFEEMCF